MGQKVPPRANRLGITENSDSITFAEFRSGEFAAILQEDTAIRAFLKKKLKKKEKKISGEKRPSESKEQ
jgi:ribosomal protein S3